MAKALRGTVYIVGAGPGDPGLITVRGMQLLGSADVVIYDRLVGKRLIEMAKNDADLIDVGKIPGEDLNQQQDINGILLNRAKIGQSVVRLKGGDPLVFGRGSEEAEVLSREDIPFEIVPGITSAIAAPAYAGIPVTHRGLASSVTFVTGSESPDKPESMVDWSYLAQVGGTIVVMMGWRKIQSVVDNLILAGLSPGTPAALVEWGTMPYQRTVAGTMENVIDRARNQGLNAPVVAIFGDVVGLREHIRWFDNRPLFGKKILVTRSRTQKGALSTLLEREGAQVIEIPTIRIEYLDNYTELDSAIARISDFDWIVFTSANTVDVMFDRIASMALDSRVFYGTKVAAIGQITADSLRSRFIEADLVPAQAVSEGLLKEMKQVGLVDSKVLMPGAETRRDVLVDGLKELGADVETVIAYRTVNVEGSISRLRQVLEDGVDVATFTSSSTVKGLMDLIDGDGSVLSGIDVACIGPVTANEARNFGLSVDILAHQSTVDGLVEVIKEHYSTKVRSDEQLPN